MAQDLVIRPARAADHAAMLRITATVWDGEDYLPEVWDSWLRAADGPPLVGEIDGEVVALAKLSDLGEGEGWFHGLRVAGRWQGQRIGRRMLEHCMERSRARGDRTLRLMTSADNQAMQRAAAAVGMHLALESSWLHGPSLDEPAAVVRVDAAELHDAIADLRPAPPGKAVDHLYVTGWRYLELTPARLRSHQQRGELVRLPWETAWAVVEADDDMWLGYAHGDHQAMIQLLRAVRAQQLHPPGRLRALVPAHGSLLEALLAAGWQAGGHYEQCWEARWR